MRAYAKLVLSRLSLTPHARCFRLSALRPAIKTSLISSLPSTLCDPEDELLGVPSHVEGGGGPDHAVRTAPVFTKAALDIIGEGVLPQRALYGSVLAQRAPGFPEDNDHTAKLYINTNTPFSGVVCGVQGSGKSHSTAVLLESCLIQDRRIGTLPAPLTSLVFHFDTAAGGGVVRPCEAAYIASLDRLRGGSATIPNVNVLVVPNNVTKMRQVYAQLPNVTVAPLYFAPEDISGDRLLAMMKVDADSRMPLYMEVIMNILRSMENFNYHAFRAELTEQSKSFAQDQKSMMHLRLSLLDSCLKDGSGTNHVSSFFRPGQLTIIDLSSPFMDASSACSFFDIILGLFIEHRPSGKRAADVSPPKVVVLDEAHKYLIDNGASSRLTESLLSLIRQQRHENMRVLISTQEPTVVPSKFLDLCSFIIAHRFSSPTWLKHLAKHVAAVDSLTDRWASKVISLKTGEAIFFAPAGLAVKDAECEGENANATHVAAIGQGYFVVRSRHRITQDGGQSLVAVKDVTTSNDETRSNANVGVARTTTSKHKVHLDRVAESDSTMSSPSFRPMSSTSTSSSFTDPVISIASTPFANKGQDPRNSLAATAQEVSSTVSTGSSSTLKQPASAPSHLPSSMPVASQTGAVLVSAVPKRRKSTGSTTVHPAAAVRQPSINVTSGSVPNAVVPARWAGLVTCLRAQHATGQAKVMWNKICDHRRAYPSLYLDVPLEIERLLAGAREDGIVVTGGALRCDLWAKLTPAYAASKSTVTSKHMDRAERPQTSVTSAATTSSLNNHQFQGLISFIRERNRVGEDYVRWDSIGVHRSKNPSLYPSGVRNLSRVLEAAEKAGFVECGKSESGQNWVKLSVMSFQVLPNLEVPPDLVNMIALLRKCRDSGTSRVDYNELGVHRSLNPTLYPSNRRISVLVAEAQSRGLVRTVPKASGNSWIELV